MKGKKKLDLILRFGPIYDDYQRRWEAGIDQLVKSQEEDIEATSSTDLYSVRC